MAAKNKTSETKRPFIVGIVLYPGFDLLDVAGANEVFTFVDAGLLGRPIETITVAAEKEVAALAPLTVKPSNTFENCPRSICCSCPARATASRRRSATPICTSFSAARREPRNTSRRCAPAG